MKKSVMFRAILLLLAGPVVVGRAQPAPTAPATLPSLRAVGSFVPKVSSLPTDAPVIGRFSLGKTYRGDLEATASGEMLGVRSAASASAGYVAMECVTGRLSGREGTFCLMHYGVMTGGELHLIVAVVPDSGTGDLNGLKGNMVIQENTAGTHHYEFTYTLPDTP